MSENICEIKEIVKNYENFHLDHISFSVPSGCIVGLVGENGAGKSTIIKSLLGLRNTDDGEITIFGKSVLDRTAKEDIGIVLDECNFPEEMNAREVNQIMKRIYRSWQEKEFWDYMEKFHIPKSQKIKEYSRGMQMKLSIAVALSHKAKFLVLDEATSGLDPVVREDVLDALLEFIQEEDHGVLISSHIISDLEKACDYIVFIHEGKVFFKEAKDELREKFVIAKCTKEQFDKLNPACIERYRENKFEVEVLMKTEDASKDVVRDKATIEDIMLFYIKGKKEN